MRFSSFVLGTGILMSLTGVSQALIVLQDTFTRTGAINGSTPDIAPSGSTWAISNAAFTSDFQADGSQFAVTWRGGQYRYVSINDGAVAGDIVTLTADVSIDTTHAGWMAVGFGQNMFNTGKPWLLFDNGKTMQTFAGNGTSNQANFGTTLTSATFKIVLDATVDAANSKYGSAEFYLNNVLKRTFNYAAGQTPNPSTISLGSNDIGGSFDNVTVDIASAPVSVWNVDGQGDWNVAANWLNSKVPNAAGAEADFLTKITTTHSVNSDIPVTVGTMKFDNANTYVIGGAGSLTIQATGSNTGLIEVDSGTQKINLPTTIVSATSMKVAAGATLKISNPLTVNAALSQDSTGGNTGAVVYESTITVNAGGSVSFPGSVSAPSLNLAAATAAASIAPSAGPRSVLQLGALSLAAGTSLSLNNNDMVIHNGSLTAVNAALAAGTLNAAADPTGRMTLAAVVNTDGATIPSPICTTLDGVAVSQTDVLVKYTYFGDANLDGVVNGTDYTRIDAGYGNVALKGWFNGDFNRDGVVDGSDYSLIDGSFGAALSALPASSIAAPAASIAGPVSVPEPTTIGLLALGATTLVSRRTRRSR